MFGHVLYSEDNEINYFLITIESFIQTQIQIILSIQRKRNRNCYNNNFFVVLFQFEK